MLPLSTFGMAIPEVLEDSVPVEIYELIEIEALSALPPDLGQGATPNPPNLARAGTVWLNEGIQNTWQTPQPPAARPTSGGVLGRINDGVTTGGLHDFSWNAHGMAGGSTLRLATRWDTPQTLSSMRILWGTDGGGVQLPVNATLQYWNGTAYVPVSNMRNAAGALVTSIGTAGSPAWQAVSFDPVETTRLQITITNGSNGAGIFQWEIFGITNLAAVDLNDIPEDFFMGLHQNAVLPAPTHGSTFVWNSSNTAALANDGTITRIATNQTGTVTLTATNGEFTANRTFNFSVLRLMPEAEAPTINTQPQAEVTINAANPSADLSVVASVTDYGTLTYQWERYDAGAWVAIDGATASTFAVPTVAAGTFNYRVVITNTNPAANVTTATTTSAVAVVTVVPSIVSVAVRPSSAVVRYGRSHQFNVQIAAIADAAQLVNWTLEGTIATGTSISPEGLLTLAYDQPLGSIIVRASSALDETIYATANVLVTDIDGVRSPNVYHNSMIFNPDTGIVLSAGGNAALLSAFDHTGWHLNAATMGPLGPAVGYQRLFRGSTGSGAFANTVAVFTPNTNANFSPGNFLAYRVSTETGASASESLFFRRNAGDANSEFAIYNGNASHGTAAGNNPAVDFGSDFLDVEIHAGHRLTSGAGSIVFRFLDENNFYFLRARAGQTFQLGRMLNGEETIIATSAGAQTMPTGTGAAGFRLLRLTVENNAVTLRTSTQMTFRASSASWPTTVFNNVSLIPAGESEMPAILNQAGQVGFRADNNNVNAMWNHVQIASLDTNFSLTSPEGMFRIETGANGNLQSLQVLQGRNWGRLQRDPQSVGVGSHTPVELLQNEREQLIMGGRHRSLGDMRFNYQVGDSVWQTASTGNSGDSRMMWQEGNTVGVEYIMPSANTRDGIRDFSVSQTFSVGNCPTSGDYIHFDFYITNTSDETVTIRDMSMPVIWNHHFFGSNSGGAPADAYTWWLAHRNYVALHGSYIMLERMDGASSKVVMIMDPDTEAKLEYRRYDAGHDNYSTNMMEEFFIYSVGVATGGTNGTRNQSYLPNTQLVLEPGESSRYGFKIFHIDDYPDLQPLMHDQGVVGAVVNPGTVIPQNMEALVAIYAQEDVYLTDITPLPGGTATWFQETNRNEWTPIFRHVEDRTDEEGRRIQVFGITFNKLGRNDIQINFAPDEHDNSTRASVMQFWVMEDIGDAIQRHADFIMDYKWISPDVQAARLAAFPPNSGHSGTAYRDHLSNFVRDHLWGFMQFQNTGGYARAGTGNAFACNNSDYEQYGSWVNFLAEKNITMPIEREVQAIEMYLTELAYPKNVQPFGGYVDDARVRTDGLTITPSALDAAAAAVRVPSNNIYREGVLAVKCCWQTNGFRMGGNSTTGGADTGASRGIMHVYDRTYNYLHMVNQFFAMYQIIRNNPHVLEYLQTDWCAVDYLRVAGIIAAESTTGMSGFGKMGESTIFELYQALRYEYAAGNHGTFTLYNPDESMQPLAGGGRTPRENLGQRATSSAVIADRMRSGLTIANGVPTSRPTGSEIPIANPGGWPGGRSGFAPKANNFSMTNPYGSEFWVDNTSEEGVYFLTVNFATHSAENAPFASDRWNPNTFHQPERWQLPERVVDKMLGWTGMQPLWYHESTSRPMGNDWWNFQYTVGMQGAALQHWFFNFEPDTDRTNAMWNHVYSSSLAPFVGIMSGQPEIQIGPLTQAAANNTRMQGMAPNADLTRQGRGPIGSMWFINNPTRPYDFASTLHSMYAQTGEGGLLLWGGLRILHTSVVPNDPHLGLTAYGGTVELVDDEFVVVPQDGLRRRLSVVGQRFQANLRAHQYAEARIRTDFMGVEFDIENPSGLAREGFIEIRMLEPGTYFVYVDGVREEGQVLVEHATDRNNLVLPTLFSYNATGAATQTIRIIHEDFAAPVEPTGISFTLPAVIRRNQAATPELTVLPANALQGARWTSSNPALASVDAETGVVTARATSGVVVITATTLCGNFRHSVTVRLSA